MGINHLRGWPWLSAIPPGYELSLLGGPLFLIGGVGDLIWHTLFGFEANIEALLSPTHLLLAFSALLILAGPLRAAWQRTDPVNTHNWRTLLPALLSFCPRPARWSTRDERDVSWSRAGIGFPALVATLGIT